MAISLCASRFTLSGIGLRERQEPCSNEIQKGIDLEEPFSWIVVEDIGSLSNRGGAFNCRNAVRRSVNSWSCENMHYS